jgi:hypothetical protein
MVFCTGEIITATAHTPPRTLPTFRGERFVYPSDPESYAGGSISSWLSYPRQISQNVGNKQSVILELISWGWAWC